MVFVDTDVLSTFAKIQRLPLLFTVFNQELLYIAFAVEQERRRDMVSYIRITSRCHDPVLERLGRDRRDRQCGKGCATFLQKCFYPRPDTFL